MKLTMKNSRALMIQMALREVERSMEKGAEGLRRSVE
jgi:hypothetical protein